MLCGPCPITTVIFKFEKNTPVIRPIIQNFRFTCLFSPNLFHSRFLLFVFQISHVKSCLTATTSSNPFMNLIFTHLFNNPANRLISYPTIPPILFWESSFLFIWIDCLSANRSFHFLFLFPWDANDYSLFHLLISTRCSSIYSYSTYLWLFQKPRLPVPSS